MPNKPNPPAPHRHKGLPTSPPPPRVGLGAERTVALTPIASEVAGYVAWLRSTGYRVVRVKASPLPGVDTLVTFRWVHK